MPAGSPAGGRGVGVPGRPWLYFSSTISRISTSGTPASYWVFASRATSMQMVQVNPIGSGSTRGVGPVRSIPFTKQS